jgi:putative phosphoribosyl transferase
MLTQFHDRKEAGKLLAAQLIAYANKQDVIVLALPRGGVPVGFEIAQALHVPLDVIVVRKLGVPGQEELAMGAIATGGIRIMNKDVVQFLDISDEVIDGITVQELQELERREHLYRGERPAYDISGRTVILVDDGVATGATMHAAVAAIKQRQPSRVIIAVPTAAPSTCDEFATEVDELVCIIRPEPFIAVGYWYRQFSQTSDEEVRGLLEQANQWTSTIPQRSQNTPATWNHKKNTGKNTSQAEHMNTI